MSQQFRAMVVDRAGEGVEFGPRQLSEDDLPPGDVLVRVEYSSVNYKDALATAADGKVASTYPLVPGIDLAGTVVSAPDGGGPAVGARVVAIGYDLGVSRHGGYAELARLPSEWVVELPAKLSPYDAMGIGTAGFTAAMSVARIVKHGVGPGDGPVLVTGASGGVGSTAVTMLAGLGYEVIASSGKPAAAPLLRELGAASVIDRIILDATEGRPLAKQQWAAAVDCVGGVTLASVLSSTRYGGIVAASGLTGGAALRTTVLPFILRGVTLAGIDSVQLPIEARRDLWRRLGSDLYPQGLHRLVSEVALEDVGAALDRVHTGSSTGRTVVGIGGRPR
jgi:putative YhdH/YhfP family quinone oxidoreductase